VTAKLPNPLPLYHGTTEEAAKAVIELGFTSPDVAERLRHLARRYKVAYEALSGEVMEYVWQRDRLDPHVHCATNPRTAADFGRRGSEIDYFARQAIYRLRNPTDDERNPAWHVAAQRWARDEVAQTEQPVIIRLDAPHHELPGDKLESLSHTVELGPMGPEIRYLGAYFLLLPEVASKYITAIEPVARCTCWRDGRRCDVCEDFERFPGGWDGTDRQ